MLTNFIRRILGTESFPLKREPPEAIEPQVYQPPVVSKREFPALAPLTKGANRGISRHSGRNQ